MIGKERQSLNKSQEVFNRESLHYVVTIIAEQDQWYLELIKRLKVRGRMDYVDSIFWLSKVVGEVTNNKWPKEGTFPVSKN